MLHESHLVKLKNNGTQQTIYIVLLLGQGGGGGGGDVALKKYWVTAGE